MGKFLSGALVAVLLLGVAASLFLAGGYFPAAATTPPDLLDRVAPWALDQTIERAAASLTVTIADDAETRKRGMSHYVENCLPCHAAPGVPPAEFAKGLNPTAPTMDSEDVQELSDAELFWIVKNGIRMTGMPAFGVNHKDDEIRDIVAFVRHVPKLDAAEKEALKAGGSAEGGDGHHHH